MEMIIVKKSEQIETSSQTESGMKRAHQEGAGSKAPEQPPTTGLGNFKDFA
jgi:hypothetical protein